MLADLPLFVADLGRWSVAGLWLPLLGWTLVALAALLVDRWLPLVRPRVRAVLLTSILIALPLGLSTRALPNPMPQAAARTAPALFVLPIQPDPVPFVASEKLVEITAPAPPPDPLWPLASGVLALLSLLFAAGGLGYVALSALKLMRWSRSLTDLDEESVEALREAQTLGAPSGTHIRVVAQDVTPCTYGVLHSTIVLPARLDAEAQTLALRHEIAHVRHGDASAHLVSLACSALIAWHPLAHLIRRRATLRREQAADAFALDGQPTRRSAYARLLTHFSSAPTLAPALAVPRHHLHNRLTAMTRSIRLTSPGRALPLAALLVLVALIALPLRAQETPVQEIIPETFVVVERAPELLPNERDALRAVQDRIVFPPEAIGVVGETRMKVRFTVTETGSVISALPISSTFADPQGNAFSSTEYPEPPFLTEFLAEAMRAIQSLSFRPGEQRGEPKSAEMEWTIRFFVDEDGEGKAQVVPSGAPRFEEPIVDGEVFVIVDTPPRMLPSQQEAMDAMKAAVVYPSVARQAGIEGRVIVQFVVDETGTVTDPFVVRGIGGGADKEAIRVVRMMRFTPGTQRGQAVKVQMTLPVTFRLGGEETGATPRAERSTDEAYADLIRAWSGVSQYSAPQIVLRGYGEMRFTKELAASLRESRPDLPLAIAEGKVGASGTRNIRIIESDCHLQRNAIIAAASAIKRDDIGTDEYEVRYLILCPLVETGAVPARVYRALEENLDESHREFRFPTPGTRPRSLMNSFRGVSSLASTEAKYRNDNPGIRLATVASVMDATGSRDYRVVRSECSNEAEILTAAAEANRASSNHTSDFEGKTYEMGALLLCPAK